MANVTGTAGMAYDAAELRAQAQESTAAGRPAWVARGAQEQADEQDRQARHERFGRYLAQEIAYAEVM